MEIKHTLKEARSLTDPICPLGAGAECWGHSHGEPCMMQVGVMRGLGVSVPLRDTDLHGVVGRMLQDPSCLSLPELLSKLVTFPCGARVELRFHRLFSNLIYVCAKLQRSPAHIADTRLMFCLPTVSPPFPGFPMGSFPQSGVGRVARVSPRDP